MPLLLKLVVVACLLINCVDCEFAGNNITASTASDYETWTTALSRENYTKDYITQSSEIIDEFGIKTTTFETSSCENCGEDGAVVTTEQITTEEFEEISTPSYSSEIIDEVGIKTTAFETSRCEDCGEDGAIVTTEQITTEEFEDISTPSYSSEIIDEVGIKTTAFETSKYDDCGVDGATATTEQITTEDFEEISTPSDSSEIMDEEGIKTTAFETSKCDDCGVDGATATTEQITTEEFEEISTPSYTSEIIDEVGIKTTAFETPRCEDCGEDGATATTELKSTEEFKEISTPSHTSEIIDIEERVFTTDKPKQYPISTEEEKTTTTKKIPDFRKPTTSTTITLDSAEINTVCSECNHKNPKISNFKVNHTADRKVLLSWDPMEESFSDCQYQYTINSSSSRTFIPLFRHQSSNFYLYDNLWKCEKYDVVLEANNICGYKDVIYRTIYTDPEKVGEISVQIFKGFSTINWPGAISPHCSRYRVQINADTFETDNNVLIRNTTLYCANIGIQTIRSDNVSSEVTFATAKPGEINNLQIDNGTDGELKATWDSPDDPSCVSSYTIKLEKPNTNTSPTFETTPDLQYTFRGLQSCSTYTISVAAVSYDGTKGDFKERSAITIEPAIIKIVRELEQRYESGKVFLTWAAPELQEKCIAYYKITIDGIEVQTNNPPYIHDGIGCKIYNTGISAMSKSGKYSYASTTYTIPAIIPKATSLESETETIEKTKATFIVKPESAQENMCRLIRVKVTCLAVNSVEPWVVHYKMVEKDVEDGQPGDAVVVNVDGLSEFTTYSCMAQVENDAGWSSFSSPVEITTKEEVPTEPLSFTHTNIYSNEFELNWDPPYKIPGELRGYRLMIEPVKSLHFEIEECKENPEKSPEPITLLSTDSTYTFTKALPNYRYKCSIQALTIDFGKAATLELDTLSGIPDPPSNVTVKTEIKEGPTYIATALLQWLHPCKTRGIVKYFEAVLTGESSEKLKSVQKELILPHEDLEYSYEFRNLLPVYEYEVKIKTTLIEGNSSEEVSSGKFKSPDGFPSPPTSIIAQSLTDNSFSVCWKPPTNQNGKLTLYTVNITALEPIHEVPTECSLDSTKYSKNVPAEETCHTFENARPSYKYEIIVTANTETTVGVSSVPLLHGTPKSASDSVRYLTKSIFHEQTEEYNSSVLITFRKPCNINGDLTYYEISLVGKNNNECEEHVAHTLYYEWSFLLKPAFKYEVGVVVVTECSPYCKSPVAKEHFTAPAGVPPLTNSSKPALENFQENAVTVKLNKDMFGEDVGEIMYYAILLTGSEVYDSSKMNYGFWDSNEWPELGFWRNNTTHVETYQATPTKWNPFEKRNSDSAEFTLGVENCTDLNTYCNGPLRPDTKYYMEIMAFTANAYRTHEAVTFTTQIDDLNKASNVVKIIGIVVGVLGFVILCGIVVFFWRRKRAKTVDNNDAIDSQDVEYRPIRLKQFPRRYNEIKETEQVLKTEFMFLNSLSADWELPTSEALLTENRKKNRYINILPYDDIRVVLDDDMSSYINASYIKGYSNKVEYIATQGPLKSTNLDFWNMILQENVTVIVMVAHFIEQDKEKCHRYIPEDTDPVNIGDDIRIRCAAKLDFKSHCERHVKIQTNDQRHEVTHLQFLNWPDFGCPTGTENMLNFCRIMRSHVKEDPGTIVVHCSAGVGRTGTLIAVDILLQTMSDGHDIDVFNTVLKLRKQRKNMVQTQAQYEYIYTCIYDAIMDPPPFEEIKAYEPVYENLKNGMEIKVFKSDNNENIETNL